MNIVNVHPLDFYKYKCNYFGWDQMSYRLNLIKSIITCIFLDSYCFVLTIK